MPFVCDVQDLRPDTLAATRMFSSRLGLRLVDKWRRLIYRIGPRKTIDRFTHDEQQIHREALGKLRKMLH